MNGATGQRLVNPSHKIVAAKAKPPALARRGFSIKSLTMTYFHTGCSTIIGAKSFHSPVRDGKGWDRLALVIRHDGDRGAPWGPTTQLGRSMQCNCCWGVTYHTQHCLTY